MIEIMPGRRCAARVAALLRPDPAASGAHHFLTARVPALPLDFEGPKGDSHAGWTRGADARTPWYRRGETIRNIRQITIVSVEELAEIAVALGVPEIRPEWLGANMLVEGLPRLSFLPRGTRIEAAGGAVLACEGYNLPCAQIGRAVAALSGGTMTPQAVVKAAARRRGVIATVERLGEVGAGDALVAHIPEQWLYA